MLLDLEPTGTLYEQIYRGLREKILTADLAAGERLPSSRYLARDLGVSRNVVLLAYDQLVSEGYAETVPGAGTYVSSFVKDMLLELPAGTATTPPTAEPPRLSSYAENALRLSPGSPYQEDADIRFNFRYGLVPVAPDLQTRWRRTLSRQASSSPSNYQTPMGYLPLRRALATYLSRNRGVTCAPDNILITAGSQQALDLAARVLLEPGDTVLLEEPHYQGARQVFLAAGAKLVPAPVDKEGMRVPSDARARLAYVTPSHQFPSGAVMSLQRRLELLAWADTQQAFVLEDDYDSEYRYTGKPVAAIQGLASKMHCAERVLYIGTFSKVLFPALRLGFMALPDALVPAFSAAKWLTDRHSSMLEQTALATFITEGHFERHVRRQRGLYDKRRAALLAALHTCLADRIDIEGTNAGLHVLVWLKDVPTEQGQELQQRARQAGVGIYPVTPYYLAPKKHLGLLFGYAALSETAIAEGIKRFATLL